MFYRFARHSGLSRYRRRGTGRRAERLQRERDDEATVPALRFLPSPALPNTTLALAPWAVHGAIVEPLPFVVGEVAGPVRP